MYSARIHQVITMLILHGFWKRVARQSTKGEGQRAGGRAGEGRTSGTRAGTHRRSDTSSTSRCSHTPHPCAPTYGYSLVYTIYLYFAYIRSTYYLSSSFLTHSYSASSPFEKQLLFSRFPDSADSISSTISNAIIIESKSTVQY